MYWVDSLMALRIGKYTVLKDDIGLYLELEFTAWFVLGAASSSHGQAWNRRWFLDCIYPPNPMDIEDKGTHVEIKRADIYEISVVDEPADSAARIINDAIDSSKQKMMPKRLIRSMGFPGDYAKELMARLSGMQKPHEEPVSKKDPLLGLMAE